MLLPMLSLITADLTDLSTLSPRDRILYTAHDLFYREGIRATGIDRVIAQAGVAKVTFYRHFPSKDELVLAFLNHRHEQWMAWFKGALNRHRGRLPALAPALAEWLESPAFRGCAFINAVCELGSESPDVVAISRRHKAEMQKAIASWLPPTSDRSRLAGMVALAVDGAIVRAQFDGQAKAALKALKAWLTSLDPEA